jgi:hypothetical protein
MNTRMELYATGRESELPCDKKNSFSESAVHLLAASEKAGMAVTT